MAKPDAIKSMADVRAGINLLVYGDNGVGKTPLIGSSPDALILNADPPDSVLSAKISGSTADIWHIRDWHDADEAHEYLRHEKHPYKWVWLDSIPGMQEGGLAQLMDDLVAAKPARNRFVPDQHEYLENMNRLRLWVRYMSALPVNFGITAHPFRTTDNDDEEITYPWVQGKNMPQTICGFMNVIGYLRLRSKNGTTEQVLHTSKLTKYYTRDRYYALPTAMVNPTIPKIEKAIMDKIGGDTLRKAIVNKTALPAKKAVKKSVAPVKKAAPRIQRKA